KIGTSVKRVTGSKWQAVDQAEPALGIISEPIFVHGRAVFPKQKMYAEARRGIGGSCPRLRLSNRVGGLIFERNNTEAYLSKFSPCRLSSQQKAAGGVVRPRHWKIRWTTETGDYVRKSVTPTGLQCSINFAIELMPVGNIHHDVLRPHNVKAQVLKRHRKCIALPILHFVRETSTFR